MKRALIAAALLVATASMPAQAAPIYVDLGTSAPPGTLGGFAMTAFPDDPRAVFTGVTSVPSPLGGNLAFDTTVSLREIGSGWATWSHGYTGDVYSTGGSSLGMTLPAGTAAFYFYLEPDPFSVIGFTVTASDGSTSTLAAQAIDGLAGARGFGFYTPTGSLVNIASTGGSPFAVGEFGIAQVPEPGILSLLGLAVLAVSRRVRHAA